MTGAYEHRWEKDIPTNQTELDMDAKLEPPYNGLFWCYIRNKMFRWPEYISFYRAKRL